MNAGDRLAHYEIVRPIGAGGMGEVFLARDTRLDRDVALKLLPTDFAADAERLARFRREAKLLAALSHQNIAGIHGLEEDAGRIFLAMELAAGETLAAVADRGAQPLEEVLRIGVQMAAGLEAAHDKGIVHRDLKPANVKLAPDGEVKILDFGLARAYAGEEVAGGDPGASPTLTAAMTADGMILGTAAYMSPEQARGHEVDGRTDVWAFGVIVYELLSGRRLFHGETVSDTLAHVLRSEPDWEALPTDLPPSVRRLLRRCLQKDRKRRLHHMADARIVLEEILSEGTSAHEALETGALPAARRGGGARWAWTVAVICALVAGTSAWLALRRPAPAPERPLHAEITLPEGAWLSSGRHSISVSPDGARFAVATVSVASGALYVRDLAATGFRRLPGTDDAETPSFSPDGRWLAFMQDGVMRKTKIDGGQPVDICKSDWGGGVWLSDGSIVFTSSYAGGLAVIGPDATEPRQLTTPDAAAGELGHWWPDVLPGGKWVTYTAWASPKPRLMALNLASGETHEILRDATYARWVPTGHLVFVRENQLMAVPFDPDAVATTGQPVPVLDDIYLNSSDGYSFLDFSDEGTLVYAPASEINVPSRIAWIERDGTAVPIDLPERLYEGPRVDASGRRVAVTIHDGTNRDIWLCDLERGTSTRFTFTETADFNPVWTPDGRTIIYNHEQPQFAIWSRPADGSAAPKPLLQEPIDTLPSSVSPDGRWLVHTRAYPETGSDIWLLPLDGEGEARPLVATPFSEVKGQVSPDGRWLAYVSNESGRNEVYVVGFPDGGSRVQVSIEGGSDPVWNAGGSELLFRDGGQINRVEVGAEARPNGEISVGRPEKLFSRAYDFSYYNSAFSVPDAGGRLLMIDVAKDRKSRRLQIVTGWFTELTAKLAEAE
ncbi:protein kinase [bacterium]|nr:protein kinase [bacterium]